ncbi:MAG: DUF1501 domain-containing protein [Pirellulaceae bacterium]|nr:DUF1501 domain-containing protein [Pirellulaceae bacterium]
MASLLADSGFSVDENPNPLQAASPKAKNVIFLHMVGAPSHLDLFDYKKSLQDHDGELCPDKYLAGQRFAFLRGHPKLLGTRFQFKKFGKSGQQFSELLPHLSSVGDEICLIKTLHTTQFNHAPAQLFFQTGFERFGRPTLGSWLSYGLGSENQDLPAFVVLITGSVAGAGNSLWGSGFLPTEHQGVEFRSKGDPVLFLSNPKGVDRSDRRQVVDGINFLNSQRLMDVGDPEISTRIKQYELAFRMQASVPELMDISQETKQTHQMYGTTPGKSSFANNCLLARRLVERGVRYVQLFDQGWDHHGGLFKSLPAKAKQVDRPIAALIQDLKQRGLLEETLVVWGSEFGRTPMQQSNATVGRDHHKDAFTVWMAGGGVKGGMTFGQTDELGYFPVENPVEVHDFHATLLHLLGLDHQKLTFRYQGRKFRLTDVAGNVITDIVDS